MNKELSLDSSVEDSRRFEDDSGILYTVNTETLNGDRHWCDVRPSLSSDIHAFTRGGHAKIIEKSDEMKHSKHRNTIDTETQQRSDDHRHAESHSTTGSEPSAGSQ